MYANAVGSNPGNSVLSGLRGKGDAGAFAKGQGMAAAAGLNLEAANQNQQLGMQQMQDESGLRQKESQNKAQRAENDSQARMMKGALDNRRSAFDTNMAFDYAGLRKRQNLQIQQALLNGVMRDF